MQDGASGSTSPGSEPRDGGRSSLGDAVDDPAAGSTDASPDTADARGDAADGTAPASSGVDASPPVTSDAEGEAVIHAADGAEPNDASDAGNVAADGGAGAAPAKAIHSGVPWLDTNGHLVNAHGVGFLAVGSTYYMIGEQRSGANDTYTGAPINGDDTFTGVSLYSTTDFANWTFVGTIVRPIPGTVVAPPYCGERPKLVHNRATGKYIVYIKMLNYTGAPPAYVGYYAVLTSDQIAGPYTYQGNLSLTGASDFQVFQDADGVQYLVRDGGRLYKFSTDGLSIAGTVASGVQSGEGVSLYKAGATYFWQSSRGTYWYSNDDSYSTATSLSGPWTAHGLFCPTASKTWQSQDTAVVTIAGSVGTTYVYVGDRWVNGDLAASTLVVQPLTVSGSTESIAAYHAVWSLDAAAGTWTDVTPSGVSVNDSATGTGSNQFDYGAGWTHGVRSGCFGGDVHSSSVAGATATIAFTGTQILLYSAYDGASGILGITLDDAAGNPMTPEERVSLRYDAPPTGDYMVYASPVVPVGSYTLTIRVTGLKDLYSSGPEGNVDRVLIVP